MKSSSVLFFFPRPYEEHIKHRPALPPSGHMQCQNNSENGF